MAIDYGAMMALTEALKGTSEARNAKRQQQAQMRQELLQEEQMNFQNAQMIGAERDAITKLEADYMSTISNIPHMRDYMTNYFDEKKSEFKSILKTFNGRYSNAMSSGKVLDFRDSIVSGLTESKKYQDGLKSAKQLALLQSYSEKEGTRDLISRIDLENRSKFLNGEIGSFSLSGLRSAYDPVDLSQYYEGEIVDFEKVFDKEYMNITHNYALEKNDPKLDKLKEIAKREYPGDPNGERKVLMDWAKKDMGIAGAYDPEATGIKELDNVAMSAQFKKSVSMVHKGRTNAQNGLLKTASLPIWKTVGSRYNKNGIDKVGKVQIGGYEVFTGAPQAPQRETQRMLGADMKSNGDGTYDFNHVKGMYDSDGVYIDGYEAKESYEDMSYKGTFLVNKIRYELEDGTIKEHILGDSTDRDLKESLDIQYKGKDGKTVSNFVTTMVGVYQNDRLGKDDQVMIEMDPTNISMERIIGDMGVTEETLQRTWKSERDLARASQKEERDQEKFVQSIRLQQQRDGNKFYKGVNGEDGIDPTMDQVNQYLSPRFNEMTMAQDSKGILYSIASVAAKNSGQDFATTSSNYMKAMSKLLNGTDEKSKEFQKAIESKDDENIFDVLNSMFGDIGDKEEILKLADIWSTYN